MPGGELFYYDSGDNSKPVMVLIHGLADEADTWRHVFPLLVQAGYRVIAPDLPGFGRSLWKGRISVGNHCAAVIRLVTTIGAASTEKPAVFAGSSLGAGIAELAAATHPGLVKALILIDGCFPFAGSVNRGLFLLGFSGKGWYRAFRSNHEAAWKSLYPYYGDLDAMSGEDRAFLRERVIARVTSANQERGYFATLRSMNAFFLFGTRALVRKIPSFPARILVLWGEKDVVFPQEKTAVFRGLCPAADFCTIPGAGHLPHQEKPGETAAKMLQFLRENTPIAQ